MVLRKYSPGEQVINKIQASGLLQTWFKECNIGCETADETVFAFNNEGVKTAVEFDPQKIMSTDLDVCMNAFHIITERLGYGKTVPLNRGKASKKRIFDDRTLARWRHSLRR